MRPLPSSFLHLSLSYCYAAEISFHLLLLPPSHPLIALESFGGGTTPILSHFGIIEKSFGGFQKRLKSILVSSPHEVTFMVLVCGVVANRS
jgi:hypothetical protein